MFFNATFHVQMSFYLFLSFEKCRQVQQGFLILPCHLNKEKRKENRSMEQLVEFGYIGSHVNFVKKKEKKKGKRKPERMCELLICFQLSTCLYAWLKLGFLLHAR